MDIIHQSTRLVRNMIVNAELFVKDLPGQLIGSLEPVSIIDGNILEVVHDREKIVNHRICLNVTFEIEDSTKLEKLKEMWKSRDIIISRIGSIYESFAMDYMLIGDIDAHYLETVVDEATSSMDLVSTDIRYTSKTTETSKRTGLISVKARSQEDLDKIDGFFNARCRKDNVTYVRGV